MKKSFLHSKMKPLLLASLSILSLLFFSFFNQKQSFINGLKKELKQEGTGDVSDLEVYPGLELSTFATEPMLKNPTNIEVDAQGRIWVLEAYNYRPAINGNPTNPEGDRILILEDTNKDGKADKQTVFYQSKDLNAPLGIAVLDNVVIVSQSPYIWKMYDDNRDGKADRKEILFQGIGGEQHDHGAHAFVFGPDGKLYFNMGNEGKQLFDAKGRAVLDQDGDPINQKKYRQGLVFRCNLDGSHVEVLGHNFRNNFEVAVDSYGGLWQSDNDDDGNKGVRINAVFEHGNYGYVDEKTGEGWYINRTNTEKEVPLRHWHLNDPGVVPNLLQTGSGSPTGMILYEGNLLPEAFQNQMIHCDAGPNVVRAYPVQKEGAGFKASILNLVNSSKDQWFRPSDVCVAPDGSVFIADWYDPGVGGHQAGDQTKGRIYRVAPKKNTYQVPSFSLETVQECINELKNPNLARRYLAYQALLKKGSEAKIALEKMFELETNPRMKARAFWVLNQMNPSIERIANLSKNEIPELRMTAIRAAKQYHFGRWKHIAKELSNDSDIQVKRELVIALRHESDPKADEIWVTCAKALNPNDRWYLEALGIGADGNWNNRFSKLLDEKNNITNEVFQQIVWRSRGSASLPYLLNILADGQSIESKLAYFRALDFVESNEKTDRLIELIQGKFAKNLSAQLLTLRHLQANYFFEHPEKKSILLPLVHQTKDLEYLELVQKYKLYEEKEKVLSFILNRNLGNKASQVLYDIGAGDFLQTSFLKSSNDQKKSIIEGIKGIGNQQSVSLLFDAIVNNSNSSDIQREAAKSIGNAYPAEESVLKMLKEKKIPEKYIPSVVESLSRAWRKSIRIEANSYLGQQSISKTNHPSLNELVKLKGNPEKGIEQFVNLCSMCHQINDKGIDFGPKLSEIGSKLSREGMYIALLHPNAGIGFGYEGFDITMKNGDSFQGIIVSKNETDIALKLPGGTLQRIKTSGIKSIKQMEDSMMPTGLADGIKTQELVDLTEYLLTLKKK
jgi:putative membrane-bound dehydrogenase-like protein